MTSSLTASRPVGKPLQIALWVAQILVFVPFCLFGSMKLFMPIEQLAAMWAWPGAVPAWFLHLTGLLDVAGGLGILLPAVTRIHPKLTVLAALGCALLQIAAIVFHSSRGEFPALPLNFILLALSIFVLWGRAKRAPITARSSEH